MEYIRPSCCSSGTRPLHRQAERWMLRPQHSLRLRRHAGLGWVQHPLEARRLGEQQRQKVPKRRWSTVRSVPSSTRVTSRFWGLLREPIAGAKECKNASPYRFLNSTLYITELVRMPPNKKSPTQAWLLLWWGDVDTCFARDSAGSPRPFAPPRPRKKKAFPIFPILC